MITTLKQSFRILLPREKRRLFLFAVTDVLITILDIGVLALLLLLIDFYTLQRPAMRQSWYLQWVSGDLSWRLLALLIAFAAKNLAAYFIHRAKYHFVYGVASRIAELNLLRFFEGNYSNYAMQDSSVHIRRISQQPVEFSHYVLSGFQQLFAESVMIITAITAIIIFDPGLFVMLVAALLPPLLLIGWFMKKKLQGVRSGIKSASEKALQHLKEALSGFVETNVFGSRQFMSERYSQKQKLLNNYLAELQSVQIMPSRLMEVFAILGLLLIVAFSKYTNTPTATTATAANGAITAIPVIAIGAFLAAAYKVIPGVVKIINAATNIKTYAFSVEGTMVTQVPLVQSPHQSIRSIRFMDVSFDYDGKKVLENFSLEISKGDFIGLTGLSGKGKTTLLNLLLGFAEPACGDILINETTANSTQRRECWQNISYVKQQPFLLHDSILTNITLSQQLNGAGRLKESVKATGLDIFIEQLPNGLETIVTENGKNISGGQRQRIALARALYKDADVLLLDEPFNELDDLSEKEILTHLQNLAAAGKAVILITHNRNSLAYCTKTISLDAA